MGGWTDSSCALQDLVPFGAAALLSLLQSTIMQSRATGIADHILTLGNWLGLFEVHKGALGYFRVLKGTLGTSGYFGYFRVL